MSNMQHLVTGTPNDFTMNIINEITNSFSDRIGSGGYGEVYKGVYNGREIAVKKLYDRDPGFNDAAFKKEFYNNMKVHHKNIVQLVGYCYESHNRHVMHNGQLEFAQKVDRVLCFEYLKNGSLDRHISVESCGLDFQTRYKIIKGTAEGLNFLHNGLAESIYHLDLKPSNILLDENMEPKIADFGISRFFASTKTYITNTIRGTLGYMPPEYIDSKKISKKFDIFSFGVTILEIMAGTEGYSRSRSMTPQDIVDLVQENWGKRVQATSGYPSYNTDMIRVKKCIEIALRCVQTDRQLRPPIEQIMSELDELDSEIEKQAQQMGQVKHLKHLRIDPELELRFPFQLNREVRCCLQLTNNTDGFIAFNIKMNQKYDIQPNKGTMEPFSKCYIIVTMQAQKTAPLNLVCQDIFLLQSTRVTEDLQYNDITEDLFKSLTTDNNEVDKVTMPVIYVALPERPNLHIQ